MSEAIFKTTSQALHVSYLVLSMPPRQGAPFRNMLIRLLEDLDHPTHQQDVWLQQLRGAASTSTINFGGLSPDEIRAQCSMITAAVRERLPAPELFAILARYAYQRERGEGIEGLARYVTPSLTFDNQLAIQALAYGHFSPRQRERGFSYTEIASETGIHARTLRRGARVLAGVARTLEGLAIARLEPLFVKHGVVCGSAATEACLP